MQAHDEVSAVALFNGQSRFLETALTQQVRLSHTHTHFLSI